MLFSSSATVYGETDQLPVTEQSPRQPAISPYGNTKQICEDIIRDVVKATSSYEAMEPGANRKGVIKGIALRYFNPIGAHPSAGSFLAECLTTLCLTSPRRQSAKGNV